ALLCSEGGQHLLLLALGHVEGIQGICQFRRDFVEHLHRPVVSTSSEKLRNVRMSTIAASTATWSPWCWRWAIRGEPGRACAGAKRRLHLSKAPGWVAPMHDYRSRQGPPDRRSLGMASPGSRFTR